MKWKMKPAKEGAPPSDGEIEAFRWTTDMPAPSYPDWVQDKIETGEITVVEPGTPSVSMVFLTFNGIMVAQPGDWIIRGPGGEVYPSRAGLFETKYELAA